MMSRSATPSRRQFLAGFAAVAAGVAAGGPLKLLSAATSTDAPLPDLIVTVIGVPSSIMAGQLVKFGVRIKNQGTAATPTGVEIGVAFHVDGEEVSWSGSDFSSLATGASVTLYATGGPAKQATWVATAGNHIVTATVNDVDRFPELSSSNNSRSLAFTVETSAKPVNLVLPVISGTPTVGSVLTVSEGSWS